MFPSLSAYTKAESLFWMMKGFKAVSASPRMASCGSKRWDIEKTIEWMRGHWKKGWMRIEEEGETGAIKRGEVTEKVYTDDRSMLWFTACTVLSKPLNK